MLSSKSIYTSRHSSHISFIFHTHIKVFFFSLFVLVVVLIFITNWNRFYSLFSKFILHEMLILWTREAMRRRRRRIAFNERNWIYSRFFEIIFFHFENLKIKMMEITARKNTLKTNKTKQNNYPNKVVVKLNSVYEFLLLFLTFCVIIFQVLGIKSSQWRPFIRVEHFANFVYFARF